MKLELSAFIDGLNVGCEQERESKMISRIFNVATRLMDEKLREEKVFENKSKF